MTKYIDTDGGRIAVTSWEPMPADSLYVVDLDKVREFLQDPDHMRGVSKRWLVKDEDEVIERLGKA